jgi:hypothetical protein
MLSPHVMYDRLRSEDALKLGNDGGDLDDRKSHGNPY